jgi:hypothetical protein
MDLQISALVDGCEFLPFVLDSSRVSLFCRRRAVPPATPELLNSLNSRPRLPGVAALKQS